MSGRLIVVVGGQFGSEGKGHLTAQLAARAEPGSLVIRTGGPNAGHTVWAGETEYKLRHLPTPIAVRDDIGVALAARSVICPKVLREELALFPGAKVTIDPAATILEPEDLVAEDANPGMHGIGSTRKGIGEARVRRARREAREARELWGEDGTDLDPQVIVGEVARLAYKVLRTGADVIVEAAQGYGLGLHTPYYPFCTSADCTALDALADARISPWAAPGGLPPEVWMAVRPFPIRVAGTSGPMSAETTWEDLGLPAERTTVTNKVRRVGLWDPALVREAAFANGGSGGTLRVGLMMADQVVPEIAGWDDTNKLLDAIRADAPFGDELENLLDRVSQAACAPISAIGTGPRTMLFASDAKVVGL